MMSRLLAQPARCLVQPLRYFSNSPFKPYGVRGTSTFTPLGYNRHGCFGADKAVAVWWAKKIVKSKAGDRCSIWQRVRLTSCHRDTDHNQQRGGCVQSIKSFSGHRTHLLLDPQFEAFRRVWPRACPKRRATKERPLTSVIQ